jgi:hypothetical protein
MPVLLQEVEQAAERVSIGTDRLRAGSFLLDEVLREERAEEPAERNDSCQLGLKSKNETLDIH